MANRPSTPEIITVNSEALQTQIRDLLPSQNGFGSELQASNVITPIIDLTAAAEGSGLPTYLQTALAFGSQTAFSAVNSTDTLANSPGFYRVVGAVTSNTGGSGGSAELLMDDGLSTKSIYKVSCIANSEYALNVDLTVFLDSGITLSAKTDQNEIRFLGSVRQVATGDGTLVQPNGFPL